MFIKLFFKIINKFAPELKFKLVITSFLALIAGFMELTGILLIYPFLSLITQPEVALKSDFILLITNYTGELEYKVLVGLIGIIIALVFILKNFYMMAVIFFQTGFLKELRISINKKLIENYLAKTYEYFLTKKTADIIRNLSHLPTFVVNNFIFKSIMIFINALICLTIFVFFMVKYFFYSCLTLLFVSICAYSYNKFFKRVFKKLGEQNTLYSSLFNKELLETFHNIKEIKILNKENYFKKNLLKADELKTTENIKTNTYTQLPPYIIQVIVILAIIIMCIGTLNFEGAGSAEIASSLGVFAAAAFRLTPVFNKIMGAYNEINNTRAYVKILFEETSDFSSENQDHKEEIEFDNSISLKNISYKYPASPEIFALRDINFEIKKGEFLGIVGASGGGKTTLTDVLLGLLPPTHGEILVDGKELNSANIRAFQQKIGYVPQDSYIIDTSLKENIAIGEDEISEEKVSFALEQAQLRDFAANLSDGLNTKMGEKGIRLSEGQKQRITIARVLYRNPEIIVLDEATSALDVSIENEITSIINRLKGEKTIISIAHRLSTLKNCDRLIFLREGKYVDSGNFSDLARKYPDFDKLLNLSKI